MKGILAALLAGLVFGAGLVVSGMTQADKVIDFLDLSDAWDPSLAFVMGGAMTVNLVFYWLTVRREKPLFAVRFAIPTRRDIAGRLVGGAALIGVGWALGGYCPGPGLVSGSSGAPHARAFVGALGVGMVAFGEVSRWARPDRTPTIVAPLPPPGSLSGPDLSEVQKGGEAK